MRRSRIAFGVGLATVSCLAAAGTPDVESVSAALHGIPVRAVNPVPSIPGLYEVIDGDGNFIYVDAQVKVAIVGEMYDVAERRSLSRENLARLEAVDFDTLPLDLGIKRVKGDGRRKVAIFADPDCPYCVKLEETLRSIDDVTIYTFLYPVDTLHPSASARANAIWCSKDRDRAWTDWLLNHQAPAPAAPGCTAPLEQMAAVGTRFKVQGTPTLVFGSGMVVYGSQTAETLNRFLDEPRLAKRSPSPASGASNGTSNGALRR
jgi:thiol:disulfide interchange protein DsbC